MYRNSTAASSLSSVSDSSFSPIRKHKIVPISCPSDASVHLKFLRNKKQEFLYALLLDVSHNMIKRCMIYKGKKSGVEIELADIFKPAIRSSASAIIIAHNHPSGVSKPSPADIAFTKKLVFMGYLLSIPVLDHLIIGKNDYFSFGANDIFPDLDKDLSDDLVELSHPISFDSLFN